VRRPDLTLGQGPAPSRARGAAPPRRPGTERLGGGLALALGLLALLVAWLAQHRLGLVPCALCLLERWPYRVLAVLGLAALVVPSRAGRLVLLLCAAPLLAALLLSATHVGVEQGWWPDPLPQCTAPTWHGGSIAERLASMPLRPVKPCDSPTRLVAWLPVSMATLDFLYALLSSLLILWAARRSA